MAGRGEIAAGHSDSAIYAAVRDFVAAQVPVERELIAQGQRVEIVQRVLGHRDIRSTLTYAELQDTQVRAALEGAVGR